MSYRSLILVLFLLLPFPLLAAETKDSAIKMGPVLHFNGPYSENHTWQVSALYVLEKTSEAHPVLVFEDQGRKEISLGKILGTRFGYDFVRYDMTPHQGKERQLVEYSLWGEKTPHHFFVPAIGQSAHILYHSCNGYQSEGDRKSVGGITAMWAEINRRHHEEPFELQLGGGDQIYADGLIDKPGEGSCEPVVGKTFGVFALPSLQGWLKSRNSLGYAHFTQTMAEETERFYFDHYVRHYNEAEFKDSMASIPSLAQPDDHDYYDGCGSYPPFLQNSYVMCGIRSIAAWYAFTVQHQLSPQELVKDESSPLPSHSFLYLINEGKLAILGVDTRTERTEDQVVSPDSWTNIFNMLYQLGPDCQHLVVMLAVPVVYVSTKALEKFFQVADSIRPLDAALTLIPGMKNAFGLFELADDGRDGWSHRAHIAERNDMILKFQEFAQAKHIRVTFLGGDVHLGGVGKIYRKNCGLNDCSEQAIWQIISSPVGNITVGKPTARLIGQLARCEKDLANDCAMCVFKLRKANNQEKTHSLIAHRNFVSFKLQSNRELDVKWSTESKRNNGKHKIYQLSIPPVSLELTTTDIDGLKKNS